jgi:transcriptional regulator with XRE-family HTH domain
VDPQKYIRSLGEVIRNKRSKLGFSQEAFAAEVGLHRTYIGSIERGEKNLTMKNLIKIADKLAIMPSKLLKDTEK